MMGFVTAIGAIAIFVVVGFVVHGTTRRLARDGSEAAARTTFTTLLEDPRVARIVDRSRPSEQPMPPAGTTAIGDDTDSPFTLNATAIEGAPVLAHDARGLLVSESDVGLEVDVAQLAGSSRAATRPDDVRFVGVVEHRVMESEYRYDTVDVSVERVYVVLVDLETEQPFARLTIEAAPPAHTAVPRTVYPIEERRIWQAIERALR